MTENVNKKSKKQLTPSQKKRKYKTVAGALFIGEFLAVAAPFVAIGIANYDKYFVEYNGTKMSIAFFMALGVLGFAIWGLAKENIKNSFVTMLVKFAIAAFIFTMMGEMISDLAVIMWFGLIGLGTAFGLDEGKKALLKKADKIGKAQEVAEQDNLVQEVKEEQNLKAEQKIKVKVKVKKDEK